MQNLPRSLVSQEALNTLVSLLVEREVLRRTLKGRGFGHRVISSEEAHHLYQRIIGITRNVLELVETPIPDPRLVLTHRISQLPRHTLKLFLILFSIVLLILYLDFQQPEKGVDIWVVRVAVFCLLVAPFVINRRVRLNIEHECRYTRKPSEQAVITTDELRSIQLQSYLAHEYAHHLYFELFGHQEKEWIREGWARLVQYHVMEHLWRKENNPAYVRHVLDQVIGELEFSCRLISTTLARELPKEVRSIRTIYHSNPFYRFLTGTPGYSLTSLFHHSVGTAVYFLSEKHFGFNHTIFRDMITEQNDIE